jgi:hypothetical protein
MIPAMEQLARRIRDELNDLDRLVLPVGRVWIGLDRCRCHR